MPAKGRALPGSCWWGWEGGCDPPCGIEMGMGAQGVTPQVPPWPPTKNQQLVGHPGPSPIFAVDAWHGDPWDNAVPLPARAQPSFSTG